MRPRPFVMAALLASLGVVGSVHARAGGDHVVELAKGTTVPPIDPKAKHPPPMRTTLLIDEAQAGGKRASMASLQVSPKQRVAMHRHPGSAELLYVVEGRGRILAPGMEPGDLAPGTAVFIKPSAAHAFDVQSPQKPLRMIQVFAPLGPERVFRDRSKNAGFEVLKGEVEPNKSAYVLVAPDAPAAPAGPGGKTQVRMLLDPDKLGDRAGYLGVLELAPGAAVPEHKHDGSAELLYVLDGSVEITIAGQTVKVDKDGAIHIPEATLHSGRSAKGAKLVHVYAPGGPEQRFKKPQP